MKKSKKLCLVILDGWGHGRDSKRSAIARAKTPVINRMYIDYPSASLVTSGSSVGLPEGQSGNSEVGHLNIGAGRTVEQDIVRINNAIADGSLAKNKTLLAAIKHAKSKKKAIHLLGLVSDGGVHSHIDHLLALIKTLDSNKVPPFYVHAILDGRDTDPKSGAKFVKSLEKSLDKSKGKLASVIGRYYAMDRDNRWDRTAVAYNMLVAGEGQLAGDAVKAIKKSYTSGTTDEFVKPIVLEGKKGKPTAVIQDGDVVICFNFRTDRSRQITTALCQKDIKEADTKKLKLHYVTMTNYDKSFKDIKSLFEKVDLSDTLGHVFQKQKLTQLRAAETEKYPHVTYFLSGGREKAFKGEERLLVDSPKVATYDLQPEMSAFELTDQVTQAMSKRSRPDFVCLNYANTDMVGHTGNMKAAVKAVKTVDNCLGAVIDTALDNKYSLIIMSDHGNADIMENEDGSPNTAHTSNLVPILVIDPNNKWKVTDGTLADVAPTILHMMGIKAPKAMTGKVLVSES